MENNIARAEYEILKLNQFECNLITQHGYEDWDEFDKNNEKAYINTSEWARLIVKPNFCCNQWEAK